MKIAFQNFLTTLKRYKTASILNIAGLTIAFIAFYILMAQVHHDLSYNKSIKDHEQIYAIAVTEGDLRYEMWKISAPEQTSQRAFESCPDVVGYGFISDYTNDKCYKQVSADYYEMFPYGFDQISLSTIELLGMECLAGDLTRIAEPQTIIIAESVAETMKLGIGDSIYQAYDTTDGRTVRSNTPNTIVGIYKDLPNNSLFGRLKCLTTPPKHYSYLALRNAGHSGWTFVKLREGADAANFEKIWRDDYTAWAEGVDSSKHNVDKQRKMRLVPIAATYFQLFTDTGTHGSKKATYFLMCIAFIIITIAFINFVNFFFALIPVRIKAVNISKIFGASNLSLRWSFLFEALAMTLISLALALYLMIAIKDTFISNYLSASLDFSDNMPTIGWITLIVVVMALTAAIYPAWYITSFNPSLAVKGGFAGSRAGRWLRMALMTIQFTISAILVTVSILLWLQYRNIIKFDVGYKSDNVVTFQMAMPHLNDRLDAIMEELSKNPDVIDITYSSRPIYSHSNIEWVNVGNERLPMIGGGVHNSFLRFFNVPIQTGEDFSIDATNREWIIGEKMHLEKGVNIGDNLNGQGRVVGIIKDLQLTALDYSQHFMGFFSPADIDYSGAQFYVRIPSSVSMEDIRHYIQQTLAKFEPSLVDVEVQYLDYHMQKRYEDFRKGLNISTLFSIVAITISLMGVFGLVIFETQYRRKEIAVRRVFGATRRSVVWKMNMQYAIILIISFIIALPVAQWFANENFARFIVGRMDISWWMFAVSDGLIALITLGLVTYRSIKSANENPADVVKSE
ncbi:MAG: ABC transporter permease [Alistipes sp.]|nr:ABC transporter permease [Alistipes sp.]